MNKIQMPDGREEVIKTENIINKSEVNRPPMKRSERVSYSALGGVFISISILLLLALINARIIDITTSTLAIIAGALGFYLIYYVAYRRR